MFYRPLYLIGILITLVAAGIAIWPDFEAQNFAPTFESDNRTRLRCPIAITADEAAQISIRLRNPMTREARFGVISYLSSNNQTTLPAEEQREIYLQPDEAGSLTWTIDRSNVVYDNMVLARVYVYRSGSVPSQAGTCGVWLLGLNRNLPAGLNGQTIYFLFMGLGLVALGIGSVGVGEIRLKKRVLTRSVDPPRLGGILTAAVLCALGGGLFGYPMFGIVMILLVILILVSMFEHGPESSDTDN